MKKALFFLLAIGCSLIWTPVFSQENETPDSLGLPGDNLNLYGVLDLFQKSETLEEFEKKLNSEDSKINNLDLNGNNKIDYISVKDIMKGTAHAIVLQVAINEKETQDIAVIEVEKDKNDNVLVQIIGDELLYGKNYIIEPKEPSSKDITKRGTPNPGYSGAAKTTMVTNNYYNSNNNSPVYDGYGYYPVRSWGIINYLFFPTYIAYASPWSWGYYPGYWNSWTPLFWHSYYSFNCYQRPFFYGNFCRSGFYRNNYAHNYYGQRRSTSATVGQRSERGAYSNTYSRRDLASKEGRSPASTRVSNSTYQNTRTARETSQNRVAGRERNTSSGNREISRSTYQNTRVNSETAQARNSVRERNPSGNREIANSNYQNNRTNRGTPQNRDVNERTASARSNNRGNRVAENNNNSGRQNNSVRQNGNSSTRSGAYSAPSSRSYSAPSHSGGGGNRSFGGGGGGGGRSSGGGGFSGGGGGRGR